MLTHTVCRSARAMAVTLAVVTAACSAGPAIPRGKAMCRVHRAPLITVQGFSAAPGVIVDPGVIEVKALSRYPHFIPSGESLRRSADHPARRQITYCPKCEAAVKTIRGLQRI